ENHLGGSRFETSLCSHPPPSPIKGKVGGGSRAMCHLTPRSVDPSCRPMSPAWQPRIGSPRGTHHTAIDSSAPDAGDDEQRVLPKDERLRAFGGPATSTSAGPAKPRGVSPTRRRSLAATVAVDFFALARLPLLVP